MSADDEQPVAVPAEAPAAATVDLKERYRRAIAFLQRTRDLPELTPAQIDRIERRLHHPRAAARRPLLSPALAALFVLLLAGGALAMAGRDLTRLPGVGRWIGVLLSHGRTSQAPETRGRTQPAQSEAAAAPVRASARLPGPEPAGHESTPAPLAEAPRASIGIVAPASGAASPARVRETRVALAERQQTAAHAAARTTAAEMAGPGPASEPALSPAPPPTPAPNAPAPQLPAAAAPSGAPRPAVIDREIPRSSPPEPAAPERTIVAESRSFASALALWHRDHDAAGALAALDAHERGFPAGQIQLEARLLRAEILLASARDREALALLDQLGLGGVPRARELRTVRGELRIKAGRCADGKADLEAVLANGESDAFAQRARKAIAACP